MGWTERDLYESSPQSVYYAFEGYFSKRELDERVVRNLGWVTYRVNGGKTGSIESFWPIGRPKEKDVKTLGDSEEEKKRMWDEIMKANKVIK